MRRWVQGPDPASGGSAVEGRDLWASIRPYLERESLAAFFVGDGEDGGLGNHLHLVEHGFDLAGGDVFAGAFDHVL